MRQPTLIRLILPALLVAGFLPGLAWAKAPQTITIRPDQQVEVSYVVRPRKRGASEMPEVHLSFPTRLKLWNRRQARAIRHRGERVRRAAAHRAGQAAAASALPSPSRPGESREVVRAAGGVPALSRHGRVRLQQGGLAMDQIRAVLHELIDALPTPYSKK